jgi:radical SAM superfamily enzyme YgiQ (UPF0313 family)
MRLGLLALSGLRVRTVDLAAMGVTLPQFVTRGQVVASMPSLGLLTVAGLTPQDVEIVYREIDALPDDSELETFDLVAISSFTARIEAAYRLADRYRAAGVPVVLGGLHVTALPDEAQAHADSIVVNGAEEAWPRLIADFRAGMLQPRYVGRRTRVFEPQFYGRPRYDLLAGRPYNRVTVQTSRGCPINCAFCAASLRITQIFQQKAVEIAVDEIREATAVVDRPFLELADDNTFVNRKWGKAFLRALRPLDLKWFTETDVSVADDPELLDLLAESGCRQVLVGLESPSAAGLAGIDPRDWKLRRHDTYVSAISRIQSRGVAVNGCFVVGHDSDTPEVFEDVRDFVRESGLQDIQVTVLTPFPGTPLYQRLRREKRLFEERFWDRCTLFDLTFHPMRMSVDELERGLRWLYAEIYSDAEFARRKRHYMEVVKGLATERARLTPQPMQTKASELS